MDSAESQRTRSSAEGWQVQGLIEKVKSEGKGETPKYKVEAWRQGQKPKEDVKDFKDPRTRPKIQGQGQSPTD